MYGFSEDEQLLVFMDGFGLTRLRRPKQTKTNTKIAGSESGGCVTISRDGSVAASYEDLWDKSVIWRLPELSPTKRFDRFNERGAIVHPEGTHYIVDERGKMKLEPLTQGVLLPSRLDAPIAPAGNKPAKAGRPRLGGGELLPALEFDETEKDYPDVPAPLRIAHDGTLLRYHDGELIYATLTRTSVTVHWRRAVRTTESARLELYADAERCVLMVHRDRRWTIFERMTQSGDERSFEIESLGVPAVAGRTLAYQPTPDLVVRRDLDTGEQTEHSLSIYAKSRKIDLRNEGVGTIFLGAQGSLLMLANHRESILDLIAGVEIPRKLSPKDLDIRQATLAIARPYVEAALLVGACIELGQVELDSKHKIMSISQRIAGGGGLVGALLAAHSTSVWRDCPLPNGWQMSSYGGSGGVSYDGNPTVDALVECYETLGERGVGFASTLSFWASRVGADDEPILDTACVALLAQALLAVVRDGPDAPVDFAALAKQGTPTIEQVIAAYAAYPQRTEELDYSCTELTGVLFNRLYGADAARLWIVVYLDAEGWEDFGTHYTDFERHGVEPVLDAYPEVAEQFKAWFRSHEVAEDDRQYYLERLQRRLGM